MGATKFVLFIVEGETDELALGRALTSLFASGEHPGPRFGIVRGDITSVHARWEIPLRLLRSGWLML